MPWGVLGEMTPTEPIHYLIQPGLPLLSPIVGSIHQPLGLSEAALND